MCFSESVNDVPPNMLRTIGIQQAHGRIIGLLEDHGRPSEDWAACVVNAHQAPVAAAGGVIENGVDRPLNWATYFCDFARYAPPRQDEASHHLSDVNVSYKQQALEAIGHLWRDGFHEPTVNAALLKTGQVLWFSPSMVVCEYRTTLFFRSAIHERYIWGRYYAGNRVLRDMNSGGRLLYLSLSPVLPFLLMARKTRDVFAKKRSVKAFLTASPLTFLLLVCWSMGEFAGYLAAKPIHSYGVNRDRELPNTGKPKHEPNP